MMRKKFYSLMTFLCIVLSICTTQTLATSLVLEGITEGQVLQKGDVVHLTIRTDDGTPLKQVTLVPPMIGIPYENHALVISVRDLSSSISFPLKIKTDMLGKGGFYASGFTSDNSVVYSNEPTVNLVYSGGIEKIKKPDENMLLIDDYYNPKTLYIYGRFKDGAERVISTTQEFIMSVENTDIAEIDKENRILGNLDGKTNLFVSYKGATAKLPLEVFGVNYKPEFKTHRFPNGRAAIVGQPFIVNVKVKDDDPNPPVIYAENMPDGASFIDNGDGTGQFSWFATDQYTNKILYITFYAFSPANPEIHKISTRMKLRVKAQK